MDGLILFVDSDDSAFRKKRDYLFGIIAFGQMGDDGLSKFGKSFDLFCIKHGLRYEVI